VTEVPVPATVQALLAARLDRLGDRERATIGSAAVVGEQFHVGALEAMADEAERGDVRAALRALVRRDLIGPDRSLLSGDEAYRFRHLLIRDAAYAAIPKAGRADLHARFAEWLEGVAGDRIEEQEEILGYHLERASRLRGELGPLDDAGRALAHGASVHLEAAGQRAADRGDPGAAASLFRRAADLLPEGSAARPWLLFEVGRELVDYGDVRSAVAASDEAATAAALAGQTAVEWRARIQRSAALAEADPHAVSTETIREQLAEAVDAFDALGDRAGLAAAWVGLTEVEWMPARFADAERAAARAIEHARAADDRRVLLDALSLWLGALSFGPPTPDLVRAALDGAVEEVGLVGQLRHVVPVTSAACLAWKGELDEARRTMDGADAIARELGSPFWLSAGLEWRAEIECWAGDFAAAEQASREHYQILDELGDEGHKSYAAGNLARCLCHLGRPEEAETYARIARGSAADDDVASQGLGCVAQALVRSARGEHDAAIALGAEAIRIQADAQNPNWQGDILFEVAEVLGAAGRVDEAIETAREARAHYRHKGNALAAPRVEAFLSDLPAGDEVG
jgi:tetratricopeptide (TPR) repeat protein